MRFQSRAWSMAAVFLLLSFLLFAGYSPTAHADPQSQGPDVPTDAERAIFIKGQRLYHQGLYGEAIVSFSEFLKSYPCSLIKDLNLLWLGRSYLRKGDLANAERMGLRLSEIPDTAFVGIYSEELRIARQSFGKAAAPPGSSDVALSTAPTQKVLPDKATTSARSLTPLTVVARDQRRDQQKSSPAKIHPASNRVVDPLQNGISVFNSATSFPNAGAPSLRIRIEEVPRAGTANGVVVYRLILVNEGNGIAKDLMIREELNNSLDFAGSDPAPSRQELIAQKQLLSFRVPALEPGATKVIRVEVRPRHKVTASTANQTKHFVIYRDSKGNTYHTP